MSFSIGPIVGKRDAVIRKVKEATTGSDPSQLDATKAFILSELTYLPEAASVTVQAWGHHDTHSGHRNVVVSVNQLVTVPIATPQHVE